MSRMAVVESQRHARYHDQHMRMPVALKLDSATWYISEVAALHCQATNILIITGPGGHGYHMIMVHLFEHLE